MKKTAEKGFSLIELLIVVVLISVIGLIVLGAFSGKARKSEDDERAKTAMVGASSALEALSQVDESALGDGGSFALGPDRTIEIIGECTPQTCDWLALPSPNNDSIAKGYPYEPGVNPPATKTVLLRRWRIDDVDVNLGLKEITVAVLTDIESKSPISIKKTRIGR
jgi:prepilin-type N-terminal cleavage/methylation domain-containing protein